jgi:uncharacterized surface protein with fasciclin (FAS1) repeats
LPTSAISGLNVAQLVGKWKPYLLYAPTDEAFSVLPKDQLDALVSNPQALAELLRYHIVEGYYPYGTLPSFITPGQRVLTNLQWTALELHDDGTINGVVVEAEGHMVRNGTRLNTIGQVLLPPE